MGRSLAETPTWSVATVITTLVASVFLVQHSIKRFGKWLVKTKRKALLAALEKIKEELMLFGLLSLLLGHWTILVAKICVKSSSLGARFYPCAKELNNYEMMNVKHLTVDYFYLTNHTLSQGQGTTAQHHYCPEGHEPFASFESLEQLHRLLIVLAITHVSYSFFTVTLAMLKIYSWKSWETEARMMAIPSEQASLGIDLKKVVIRRQSTFISHHTSHPWSQHKVLIWMLCFIRQFWSSINRADYLALRLGFITNHNLPMSHDFHNYMLRSMEEEFRDIVGISVLLWGYAIVCMFVNIHGTNAYFWLSFIPAILILLVGTKLHHIVSQLALEAMNRGHSTGNHFKPRDGLFWFGRPKLLLWLLQIISFQNAFEMATFLWSLWEIKEPSCFMKNRVFVAIRLVSGIIFQFWCSYNTFPLYVIITQMGTRFKKAIVAENVRKSLHGWLKRVKDKSRHGHHPLKVTTTWSNTSLESMADEIGNSVNPTATESITLSDSMADETGYTANAFLSIISRAEGIPSLQEPTFEIADEIYEQPQTASGMTDETENADNTSSNIILRDEVIRSVQESAFEIADEICEQPQTASDDNLVVSFCSNRLYEHFDDGSVDDDHAENDSCLHPLSDSYIGKSNDQ